MKLPAHECTREHFCEPCGASYCGTCPIDHSRHAIRQTATQLLDRAQLAALRLEQSAELIQQQRKNIEQRAMYADREIETFERTILTLVNQHCNTLRTKLHTTLKQHTTALAQQREELLAEIEGLQGQELREALRDDLPALGGKIAAMTSRLKAVETMERAEPKKLLPCADNNLVLLHRGSPLLVTKLLTLGDAFTPQSGGWVTCPAGKQCVSVAGCPFLHPAAVTGEQAWNELLQSPLHASPVAALNAANYLRDFKQLPNDPYSLEAEAVTLATPKAIAALANEGTIAANEALAQYYRATQDINKEVDCVNAAAKLGSVHAQWKCSVRWNENDPSQSYQWRLAAALQGYVPAMV